MGLMCFRQKSAQNVMPHTKIRPTAFDVLCYWGHGVVEASSHINSESQKSPSTKSRPLALYAIFHYNKIGSFGRFLNRKAERGNAKRHRRASQMRLKSFRVRNYRSITDSGDINIGQLTALIGRNESGKSNLLRALYSLNPREGSKVLDKGKDLPRHCNPENYTDTTAIIYTVWELDDEDQETISELWARGKTATAVTVSRYYGDPLRVGFDGEMTREFDFNAIKSRVRKIVPVVNASAAELDEGVRTVMEEAVDKIEAGIDLPSPSASAWATKARPALDMLRRALALAETELTETQDAHIVYLEDLAETISRDDDDRQKAMNWVANALPIFIYLEEYPEINGDLNIDEFLQRQEVNKLTSADKNFIKMCKVAGLQPESLRNLQQNSAMRSMLEDEASAKITNEIQRLWKNKTLNIRFRVDGEDISTLVSEKDANSKIQINFNDRSRGFRWFFSFCIIFAADTKEGDAENAILLLDEPGLHLHAKAQHDLLKHFENDFANQILYTTHSPFMVLTDKLDIVRTVNAENGETTVSENLSGDADTLLPLQAALGHDLAQSLFIGPNNLVVEGMTDLWVLSSISGYLNETGRNGLSSKIIITPVGGAQKIPYMVNFLSSQNLNVMVLLDHEKGAKATKEELIKLTLFKEKNIIFISDAFGPSPPKEADIEDLLDPKVYGKLVRESYKKELKEASLELNKNIPRIVKRFERAFNNAGLTFNKTKPMRLLRYKMGVSPDKIVTDAVAERFETLFSIINNRFFPKG